MGGEKDESGAKASEKAMEQKKADKASEDSFPASDSPSTTPVAGSRKAELNQKTRKPA